MSCCYCDDLDKYSLLPAVQVTCQKTETYENGTHPVTGEQICKTRKVPVLRVLHPDKYPVGGYQGVQCQEPVEA